jgi:L-amino acid N-acyltransferase YncA
VPHIRPATKEDRDAIWEIFHAVVAPGDTYAFDPNMSRKDALVYWMRPDTWTYVAEQELPESARAPACTFRRPRRKAESGISTAASKPEMFGEGAEHSTGGACTPSSRDIVGTYILRANQSGGGSHVANAAFMVATNARGCGLGRAMAEHCLGEARRLGFRAMQFNFVVSTNESAVHLWKSLDFRIAATLPGAFRHPTKGFVDVYVMFRAL